MFEKEPPRALVAEMALLGACILEHKVVDEVEAIIGDNPEVWSSEVHSVIWDAIRDVVQQCQALDLVLLQERLKNQQLLDDVGGLDYLSKLAAETPGSATAVHFAKAIARSYALRLAIRVGGELVYGAYHEAGDPAELLARAEEGIFGVVDRWGGVAKADDAGKIGDLVNAHLQRMYALQEGELVNAGEGTLATGYSAIDEMTGGGLHAGQMVVVGARPGMGKTALAIGMTFGMAASAVAEAAALSQTGEVDLSACKWIVFVSLEMAPEDITTRCLSSLSGIPYLRMRGRRAVGRETVARDGTRRLWVSALSDDEARSVGHAGVTLAELPIYIDNHPSGTLPQLRSRVRRLSRMLGGGVGAVVVDYLQLLHEPKTDTRQEGVAAISRGLKAMAMEMKIPVVALCQLNRASESRGDKRPYMSDLRESGAIEQDADVVMLLHREAYYHVSDDEWAEQNRRDQHAAELIVAKQRNGPTDVVRLAFHAQTGSFVRWREDIWGGITMNRVQFGSRLHGYGAVPAADQFANGTPFDGPTIGPGGNA